MALVGLCAGRVGCGMGMRDSELTGRDWLSQEQVSITIHRMCNERMEHLGIHAPCNQPRAAVPYSERYAGQIRMRSGGIAICVTPSTSPAIASARSCSGSQKRMGLSDDRSRAICEGKEVKRKHHRTSCARRAVSFPMVAQTTDRLMLDRSVRWAGGASMWTVWFFTTRTTSPHVRP
jgi:hypothetical protein